MYEDHLGVSRLSELNQRLGDYWIANQILSKGLHNSDDDALRYTMGLMDKLEKVPLLFLRSQWPGAKCLGIDEARKCWQ